MRAIVGVQMVRSGTVTVLGQPAGSPDAAPPGRLRHPGARASTPTSRVRENARYFAALYGARRAPTPTGAIADVGLADAAGQLVGNLSGGQRSRASLACALVGAPELLVLDEPTVGQDPVLRVELWERFHALAAAGTTLLVSSHVMDEAGRCDRLLLIREGRLIADDTPAALRAAAGTDDLEEAFLRLIRASGTRPDDRRARRREAHASWPPPPAACCASCGTTGARSR